MKPEYIENFIPSDFCYRETLFFHLSQLPWLEVTEPRKEYFMSDTPVSYLYGTGQGKREYLSKPFTPEIKNLLNHLNEACKTDYNICFLNKYDGQKNHLGWHADDSPSMDLKHPIAVVSLGTEREIWWKKQDYKGEIPKENRQLLGNGSLFVMPAGFQEIYYHRIPKCDRSCGTRISLTFRKYIHARP